MSTYKIVSNDYTINCGETGNIYTGTFTINAANIIQNGNITTTGNSGQKGEKGDTPIIRKIKNLAMIQRLLLMRMKMALTRQDYR